MLNLSINHFN